MNLTESPKAHAQTNSNGKRLTQCVLVIQIIAQAKYIEHCYVYIMGMYEDMKKKPKSFFLVAEMRYAFLRK